MISSRMQFWKFLRLETTLMIVILKFMIYCQQYSGIACKDFEVGRFEWVARLGGTIC